MGLLHLMRRSHVQNASPQLNNKPATLTDNNPGLPHSTQVGGCVGVSSYERQWGWRRYL